jgi:DNA-binding transcriptional ArsR family regulator
MESTNNDVFKALADPSRRLILDLLFDTDGQSLSDLTANVDMTRFGVMKHLKVLEEAGLITTKNVEAWRRSPCRRCLLLHP